MSMSIFDSLVNAGEFVEQSLAPEKRSNGSLLAGLDFSKILNLRLTQKDPESIPEIGNPNETLLNPPAEARTHSLEAPLPVYRSNLRNLSELEGVLSELIRDVANMIQSGQEIEGEQGEESRSGVDTSKLFDGNESATVFPEVAEIIDPSWQSYAVSPASTEKLVSLLVKLVDRGGKNETSTGTVPPNKIETTEWSYPILSEASGYGDNSEPAASWHGSGFPKMDLFAGAVSVKDDISLTVWTNIARNEKIAGSGPSVKTPENSDQIVNYASAFEADQHDVPAGNADRAVGSTGESRLAVPFREGIWIEITSANADRTPPSSSGLIDGRSRDQNYVHADESPSIPIGKPTDGRAEMRAMNAGQSVIEKSSDEPVPLQILERSNYRRLTIPIQPNGPLSDAYSLDRGNSRIISVFVPRQTQCSDSTSGETGSTSGTGEKTPLPSGSSTTTAGFARESGQVAELASGTLEEGPGLEKETLKEARTEARHNVNDASTSGQPRNSKSQASRFVFIPPAAIKDLLRSSGQIDGVSDLQEFESVDFRMTETTNNSDLKWEITSKAVMDGGKTQTGDIQSRMPKLEDMTRLRTITAGISETAPKYDAGVSPATASDPISMEFSQENTLPASSKISVVAPDQQTGQIDPDKFKSESNNQQKISVFDRNGEIVSASVSGAEKDSAFGLPGHGIKNSFAASATQTASNGGSSLAQTADMKAAIDQIVRTARVHLGQGNSQIEVKLKPEYLGMMRIVVRSTEKEVKAVLYIERPEVRHAVEGQIQNLFRSAQEQNIRLDKVEVQDFSTAANFENQMSSPDSDDNKSGIQHGMSAGRAQRANLFAQAPESQALETNRDFGYNSLELII